MELLKQLYRIHSKSGQEDPMRKFVKNYVKTTMPGVDVRQDHGNIYITKGEAESYPCVVAHLDQVQNLHSKDFQAIDVNGKIFGFSLESMQQQGLGADDKNGIWIALRALESFPVMKVAFFWGEETGCQGSRICDLKFFKDCRFAIQPDRRGGADLINDISGLSLMSEDFHEAIEPYMKRYGFKDQYGLMTDVEQLVLRDAGISCFNVSCGYHNPHTDNEYTDWAELNNTKNFIFDIIGHVTDTYPHKCARAKYNYGYGWDSGFNWRDYYGGNYTRPVASSKVEPSLVSFWDYYRPEDAVEALAELNGDTFFGKDIWPYVQADCEDLGIDEAEFCAYYDACAEDYFFNEKEYDDDDDAYPARAQCY